MRSALLNSLVWRFVSWTSLAEPAGFQSAAVIVPPPCLISPKVAFKPYLNCQDLLPTVLNTFLHCTTLLLWHTFRYVPSEFEHATTLGSVDLCNQNYHLLSPLFPQLSHIQNLAWWKILLAIQICINAARNFRGNRSHACQPLYLRGSGCEMAHRFPLPC
jgi:hypothetical protein